MKETPLMQPRTVVVLTGLAIGLGIALHPVFFLVALAIVLGEAGEWALGKIGEHVWHSKLTHRHS